MASVSARQSECVNWWASDISTFIQIIINSRFNTNTRRRSTTHYYVSQYYVVSYDLNLINFIFSLVINSWFLVILCYLQGVICRGLGGSDPPFCTARPSHFSVRKIS